MNIVTFILNTTAIGLLALFVIIRTVLSFSLNMEIVRLAPTDRDKLR